MPLRLNASRTFLRRPGLVRRRLAAGRPIVRRQDDGRRGIAPAAADADAAVGFLPAFRAGCCRPATRPSDPASRPGRAGTRALPARRSRDTRRLCDTDTGRQPWPDGCHHEARASRHLHGGSSFLRRLYPREARRTASCRRRKVISRECAQFPPSRARQPKTVIVSPGFIVMSFFQPSPVQHGEEDSLRTSSWPRCPCRP